MVTTKPQSHPDATDWPTTDPRAGRAREAEPSLRHHIRTLLWQLVGQPALRLSFHNWYGVRATLLRMFGGDVHPTAKIRPTARITHPWNLKVGPHSAIGDNASIDCTAPVSIGRRCTVSQYVQLCSVSYDETSRDMPRVMKPITIEDDCWVAADVFVGPGVTIGEDTVVGARSTVLTDLPGKSICVGDRAKRLADRVIKYPPPKEPAHKEQPQGAS